LARKLLPHNGKPGNSGVSASSRGEGIALTYVDYAKAVLYNGLADYERAAEAAQAASTGDDILVIPSWALHELVEVVVLKGQPARGVAACERLSAMAAASGTDAARGAAALARALLADGHMADDLYQKAIEVLAGTQMVSHLARARLCYGEWLHSAGRDAEPGTQLRAALDAFSATGARAFAERLRRRLEASGAKMHAHRKDPGTDLTPHEHQIAQLARTRRTNAEIGGLVFLSARTVEWHLHNIFSKLGVSSR
jgi:ATP/maltotriose-dependent transcriptional regulator MalT